MAQTAGKRVTKDSTKDATGAEASVDNEEIDL